MSSQTPIVEVTELSKTYLPSSRWMRLLLRTAIQHPVQALDRVSLSVGPGEICAVVGPNGAGKSTLFRVLTGLTTPTSGEASIAGIDCSSHSAEVRRLIGFAPADDRSLRLRHTALENLVFHGRLQGLPARTLRPRAMAALETVGLEAAHDRVGFALSAGMRARLQLARAILHEPIALILDEPTGTIDPMSAHGIVESIIDITAQRGIAVLLSSHRLEEIETLRDKVLLLDNGRTIYSGGLPALRRVWEQPQMEIAFSRSEALEAASQLFPGATVAAESDHGTPSLRLGSHHSVSDVVDALGPLIRDVVTIRERRMSLRELLVAVLAENRRA